MKRALISKIISLTLITSLISSPVYGKESDDDYNVSHISGSVKTNKVWKIKFNNELKEATVNGTNVYIEDEKGIRLSTEVMLGTDYVYNETYDDETKEEFEDKYENDHTIIIKPNSRYVKGREYYIIIDDAVKSEKGKRIKKPIKIYFTANNHYAGLPAENGLIILKDTAYSIDYLAKNANLRNEIINDSYDVYYANSSTEQKIKSIFGNIDISGNDSITYYDTMNYIDENGDKHIYEWDKYASEYEIIEPIVEAEVTVNSTAKIIMVKVDNVKGVEGAKYYQLQHSNEIKNIGETTVFASSASSEAISILNSSKNVIATGNLITLYSNTRETKLNVIRDKSKGNTAGNINNNGYVAKDPDGYLYYNNTDDKNSLYKLDTGGLFNAAITYDNAQYINVSEGWVYYSNYSDSGKLYRIKKDGTSREKLTDSKAAYVTVSGDWIYYSNHSNGGKLYKIKVNGTLEQPVSSALKYETAYINVVGEWIYYTNKTDNHRPYVVNTEGNYITKLSDKWANSIQVEGDWIYYTSNSGVLSKVKKDGSEETISIGGQVREFDKGFHLNVVDGWLYYSNYLDNGKLYKISTDGSGKKVKLTNETVDYINIASGNIYYISKGKLYTIPVNSDGSVKGEQIKKNGNGNKIKEIDDIKVTVDFSDVNHDIEDIEKEYLPIKVPAIMDDNTMHQLSVVWDTEKVSIKNNIRYYTGEIVGYNTQVTLEMIIPSEMLNESNTITIYNNPDSKNDVVVVENEFDNNLITDPQKLNIGDIVTVYDSEDLGNPLGEAKVIREGRYNKAIVEKLELDKYAKASVWITVTRQNKAESKPTEVKQADIPSIIKAKDKDDTGLEVNGSDFEISEWVPSQVDGPSRYKIYILPSKTKLDLSNIEEYVTLGTVSSSTDYWNGDKDIATDSEGNAFKKGDYNIYVWGSYNTTASKDNDGSEPTAKGYVANESYEIETVAESIPKKPTLKSIDVIPGDEIELSKAPEIGEIAFLIPVDSSAPVNISSTNIKNWTSESGITWPIEARGSIGSRGSVFKGDYGITWLIGDGISKVMYAPEEKFLSDNIQYKLIIKNKVGASDASASTVTVDNKKPDISISGKNVVHAGENISVRASEKGKIFLISTTDNIELYGDERDLATIYDAVDAGYGYEYSITRTGGVANTLNTSKVKAMVSDSIPTVANGNYQILAVDEVGNVTLGEKVAVWIKIEDLQDYLTSEVESLLEEEFESKDQSKFDKAYEAAEQVVDDALNDIDKTAIVTQKDIDNVLKSLQNTIKALGAPLLTGVDAVPGSVVGSTKIITDSLDAGNQLYYRVSSRAISTPKLGGRITGATRYNAGYIPNLVEGMHIALYEIDASGNVVRFIDIELSSLQINVATS